MKLPATVTRLMMKRHDSQQYRGEFIQERIYGSFLHCCSAAVPILSASTLHTLIFALASAPLAAAASINFYRRASNNGTPRMTVANYRAAHPASYAQLTMAFEETQRPISTRSICSSSTISSVRPSPPRPTPGY